MSIQFRLTREDCVESGGVDHCVESHGSEGVVLRRLDESGICLSFTHEEFRSFLRQPDTRLKRGHFSSESALRRLRCDLTYLNTLPEHTRHAVLWRTACVRFALEAEARGEIKRTEDSVGGWLPELERLLSAHERAQRLRKRAKRAGQSLNGLDIPSARWLLQWIRLYERYGRSPLVFVRKPRASSTFHRKFIAQSEALLSECVLAYLDRNRPSRDQIAEDALTRFKTVNEERDLKGLPPFSIPSKSTIHRRIRLLDPFETMVQRHGIDAARAKFGFYEDGLRADYPLQRIEMDEWQIDLMTLFCDAGLFDTLPHAERAKMIGRRWIYVAMDCATRCVVSLLIVEKPNSSDAIRALELITIDKSPIAQAADCLTPWDQHGGIGILVTDNGSAFAAESFRLAVVDLGATYEAPPAGVPKLRARIERVFRTFSTKLAPMLTGRTFSNSVERGDYPSEARAALTDDDLVKAFTLFIVDIYHNTPHGGLKGETPANAGKRLMAEQGVTPPPDANNRRAVFGAAHEATLDRHGVTIMGINYTCPKLQEALLRGSKGKLPVRVDAEDLTHVSVCLGNTWHSAQAVQRSVWGLSLCEWQSILQSLRERFAAEAQISAKIVDEARRKIRTIDQDARQRRRLRSTRQTAQMIARIESQLWLGLSWGPEDCAATGDLERPTNRKPPGPDDLLSDCIASPPPPPPLPNMGGAEAEADSNDDDWGPDDE